MSQHETLQPQHDALTQSIHLAFMLRVGFTAPFIGSAIANALGEVDGTRLDHELKLAKEPCGEPGCDCEKLRTLLIELCIAYRKDWRWQMGKLS